MTTINISRYIISNITSSKNSAYIYHMKIIHELWLFILNSPRKGSVNLDYERGNEDTLHL